MEKELKGKFIIKDDNYILLSYADEVEVDKKSKNIINKTFSYYRDMIHEIWNEARYGNNCYNTDKKKTYVISKREQLIKNCRKDLEKIEVNPIKLFNIIVSVLREQKNLESVNKFIWNIFDEDIVDIIPEGKRKISMFEVQDGDMEILGRRFKVIEEEII